jgi:phthalate 4,5-dioxygenase oxygenase subunit
VPKDDCSSYFHFIAWSETPDGGIDQEAWRKFCVAQVGIDLDAEYRPTLRTAANKYLQDRQAMKLGNFTGIPGIPNQDIAMWVSMGAIADRTSERLGASDIAIVQFRRLMLDAVEKFASAGKVIGQIEPKLPQARLRSYQGIVPKSDDWRKLGASDEEIASLDGLEEDETERAMASAVA